MAGWILSTSAIYKIFTQTLSNMAAYKAIVWTTGQMFLAAILDKNELNTSSLLSSFFQGSDRGSYFWSQPDFFGWKSIFGEIFEFIWYTEN